MTAHAIQLPGNPYPLGAHWHKGYRPQRHAEETYQGVNFALFAAHAERVELCLFDEQQETRIELAQRTGDIWHTFVADLQPGQRYGYRVYGDYLPEQGLRFNPHKLLLDPYAHKLQGQLHWHAALFDYQLDKEAKPCWQLNEQDSAPYMPKCVVVDQAFDWQDDQPPEIPMAETIIYELNVHGFTKQHPEVPPSLQGTYLGLCCPAVISYLKELGITSVELMPCMSFFSEQHLQEKQLNNYWGYNSIGFFAPEARYARQDPVTEFKTLVKKLHQSGIEVIMDVVFNHTAEGGQWGPTFSFRGIDNLAYYYLDRHRPPNYINHSGCGNTVLAQHQQTLKLIVDALRHWVQVYHVDGFRFDLAPCLGREEGRFSPDNAFFDILYQDPVLSQVKLIAEPWDLAHDGYQLGNFPQGWSEWNDKFRNNIRAFWRGDAGAMGEFIRRFCGSSDIYQHRRRAPSASVNYICSHDGFTLNDLVSYQHKHNEANLENNRDGDNNNLSWNCGVEGSTDNPRILALREQYKRNLIASLMLSKGVVQLLAGDEFGNSQQGNNNSYCQDNEIGWLDWQWLNPEQFAEHAGQDLFRFCQKLIQLRKRYQTFWQDNFFQDKEHKEPESRYSQVHWFNHRGQPMQPEDWNSPATKTLCVQLKRWRTETEARQFILLFNLSASIVDFVLPALDADHGRYLLFDTAIEGGLMSRECDRKNQPYPAIEHSLVLFVDRLIDKKQGF